MNKKYIIIKGDTNDGDYITEKSEITDQEIEQIKEILKITGSNWNTRWEYDEDELATLVYKDILTEEQFKLMDKFVPSGEIGIHTLSSVDILIVQSEESLL
jgi:hypothetical protein